MSTCKAIRQEGTAKGTQCKFPAGENGYCGRHQRNKLYDDGIAEGKLWCRFFFRGCSNTVSTSGTACSDCKTATRADKPRCSHEGCTRTAKQEEKYCGKHERDMYRDQEKELGIRYCDINRGCFNLCEEGRSSCPSCLEKARESDNKRYATLKEIHQVVNTVHNANPPIQLCCYCGKDFTPFITSNHKPSQSCIDCNKLQKKHDSKRKDRVINYAQRKAVHAEAHYAEYIRSANKRAIEFLLPFEDFKGIVCKPCFYCGTFTSGESIGIDRFDNSKGYTIDNCRPCCDICNRMKWTFHPLFFIEKCKILADKPVEPEFFQTWKQYYTRPHPIYSHYKQDALKRGYEFSLTREEFTGIVTRPCYMCDYTGVTGIDRKDNKIGYIISNCMSCCYSCNMSKADIEYSKVIQTAHMVASNWDDISSLAVPQPSVTHVVSTPARKGWKASSLYVYLMNSQYNEILETLSGVKGIEELQQLRCEIDGISEDIAKTKLQSYLLAVRMRRSRTKSQPVDTITHA